MSTAGPRRPSTTGPRRRLGAALGTVLLGALAACSGGSPTPAPSTPGATAGTSVPGSTASGATSAPTAANPSSPGTQTPTTTAASVLGAKWVWSDFDSARTYVADSLKGGYTYVEVVWCDVEETQGTRTWTRPDNQVDRGRAVGVTSLLKIRVGHCWATPGDAQHERGADVTESAMPADLAAYSDFVRETVTRYSQKGVTQYAVENEIASETFWAGTAEQYSTLSRTAATAIRAANPQAQVVDGSLSSSTAGYAIARRLLEAGRDQEAVTFYNAYYSRRFGTRQGAAAIPEAADAAALRTALASPVAMRPQPFDEAVMALHREGVFDVRQVHFYERWDALPFVMDDLRATTPAGHPIEVWELGSYEVDSTRTQQQVASEAVKASALALAGGATKVLWLPLVDNPSGSQGKSLKGLLAPGGTSTPASLAYAQLQAAASDATIVPVRTADLAGVGFDRDGRSTAFVWAVDGSAGMAAPSGASTAPAVAPEAAGAPVTTAPTTALTDGTTTITTDPVRVELRGSATQLKESTP